MSQEIQGGSCDTDFLFTAECVNRIYFQAAAIEKTCNHVAESGWLLSKPQLQLIVGTIL